MQNISLAPPKSTSFVSHLQAVLTTLGYDIHDAGMRGYDSSGDEKRTSLIYVRYQLSSRSMFVAKGHHHV